MPESRRTVAAIVTEYRPLSHADVIITRLLEGYDLFWTVTRPHLEVAALYTDQVPASDISRRLAAKHGVPIYLTIRDALTRGGATLAVDGVVLIGEHGDYPVNGLGQKEYPRRRFFEETVDVFRASGRVAPVFSDKHLSWNWADAKWMYDTARTMGIPFLAGSSIPLAFRFPPIQTPWQAEIEEIVAIHHGPLEAYGFHALEMAQCQAERRRGFETGVTAVQCLAGEAFRSAYQTGDRWSPDLLAAALALVGHAPEPPLKFYAQRRAERAAATPPTSKSVGAETAIIVEYRDGLRLTAVNLDGYMSGWALAMRLRGRKNPLAIAFLQHPQQPLSNFSHQAFCIEELVRTGRPAYPVERTLLTSGVLDAAMFSHHEAGRRVATPHLDVTYQPETLPVAIPVTIP